MIKVMMLCTRPFEGKRCIKGEVIEVEEINDRMAYMISNGYLKVIKETIKAKKVKPKEKPIEKVNDKEGDE